MLRVFSAEIRTPNAGYIARLNLARTPARNNESNRISSETESIVLPQTPAGSKRKWRATAHAAYIDWMGRSSDGDNYSREREQANLIVGKAENLVALPCKRGYFF